MKKILVLNGSPREKNSCTLQLTHAFLKGLNKNSKYEITEVSCAKLNIKDCSGCFYCWKNEEGICAIKDDMTDLFRQYIEADIVIWSFPNYFYGIPATAKRVMERLLPLYYQNLVTDDQCTTYHLRRHKLDHQKYILFCSCGLYNTQDNVDGIRRQFELLYGEACDMLFCSESQLLSSPYMNYVTAPYLKALEEEGERYEQTFRFSTEIQEQFQKPFLPISKFLSFVDNISETKEKETSQEDFRMQEMRAFFRNMALTYDPSKLRVPASVLEIEIPEYSYTCQMHLDQNKCQHMEEQACFAPYRLKVTAGLSFFTDKPKSGAAAGGGPDFNMLIQLINKFEKQGISKEMKFC